MADQTTDVLVIGVGGMGSATIAALAERGVDVIGIERYDIAHANGSSHGNTRIVRRPQYEDLSYVPLVEAAIERWHEIESAIDTRLYHAVGSLDIGPRDGSIFTDSKRSCLEHNIPHEVLDGSALNRRFSGYDVPPDHRAVYQPDGGFVRCEAAIIANVGRAHAAGGTIRARERVEYWSAAESGVRVETDRATYHAETMVVTAGAWTGQLLESLSGLLEPERQVMGWFQPATPSEYQPNAFPVFVCDVPEGHYYGFPIHETPGVKLGRFNHRSETGVPSTLDHTPDRTDESLLRSFTDSYLSAEIGPTQRLSTCLFTNTPDEDFLLDIHPDHESVIVGAGFSGHGFKFASVVGDILASLALDGATEHPIDPFAIDRFD